LKHAILEADTAPHGRTREVFLVGEGGRFGEETAGFFTRHGTTFHDFSFQEDLGFLSTLVVSVSAV